MRPTLRIVGGKPHYHLSKRPAPFQFRAISFARKGRVWHCVWLPYFGVSVLRITLAGKVVWSLPGVQHYGDMRDMKKKKQVGQQSDSQHVAALETGIFAKLHPLVAHCGVTRYDDGDSRAPGWFTIKTMGAAWIVEVKDPDTAARLVVVQQTLDDALMLASVLLESEEAPWEPDPWLAKKNSEKKKK